MKTEIKKLAQSNIEIVGELSWEEFEVFFQKALKQISGQVKMGGFRPGKAPQGLVEEKIGDSHLLEEAAELAIQDKYQQIIHQEKIEPISKPEVSVLKLAKNNSFQFKIKAATLPEVKLPDYKKIAIAVEKKVSQVDDSEIEETIKWIARSRAELSELNRPCQKGDWLEMEYQSPQVEMNKKFEDAFLLGEGKFIPGFEDNLLGLEANGQKDFKITFPAEYFNKELAGQEASFQVKIKAVKEMKLPEINDDFVQKIGRFKDIAELRANIEEGIQQEKDGAALQNWRNDVLEKISQELKVELPESLIEAERERLLSNLKAEIDERLKVSFEDYLKQIKKTNKELGTELAKQAEQRVKSFLILRAIGQKEGVMATEEEITQAINKFLTGYPQEHQPEIDRQRLKEYYREKIEHEKVFQLLEKFCDK
ncbi:trigger factor [bacterium (Candidatus Gribaldobacteria) CG_4_10_14_0_2_um_filter_41_16]|uniref:Trigger factor n=2 Tax=Candidatus Gribaldobacteria TaxID=2798536 RepID=A0A2M7VJD3_9BACT|nr:MAG: trigger factor [Parcubacteria group bacterium CG1_02_41_26]PIR91318.1 MAG: trigger factor [bacterium (Candidatus Gribaldobacteria) CG10_big_fil_rev_8_21_14_0_10_41_12]PJA01913.1 MAG: trigger factor [bacterium (Candidatus Gribaldobacteria) CG_4_10_14_0_2_um_filter_41_16]